MKKFLILLLLPLGACTDSSLITVHTKVEVVMPPVAITALCPSQIERVVPANPSGKYSEPESAEIAQNAAVAYVSCRSVVSQLQQFYQDQKKVAEANNPRESKSTTQKVLDKFTPDTTVKEEKLPSS